MTHKLNTALALLSFLLLLGTVGGLELERISLTLFYIQSLLCMFLWVLFTYRAGGFYWQTGNTKHKLLKGYHHGRYCQYSQEYS